MFVEGRALPTTRNGIDAGLSNIFRAQLENRPLGHLGQFPLGGTTGAAKKIAPPCDVKVSITVPDDGV